MGTFLFKHHDELISKEDLIFTLKKIEADQCDVLYIHSGIQFGMPNMQLGRLGILEEVSNAIYSLNVPTLIMPSYTFSFCNNDIFDIDKSISPMGALSEHMRIRHKWARSHDPLMSNILFGKERSFIDKIGKNSVGTDSTFDLLSKSGLTVKFLFLGPRINDCFTYMHYLEKYAKVPYRYDFNFTGIVSSDGRYHEETYSLFIRDEGVKAGSGAKIYENILIERGVAKFVPIGGGSITVVELNAAKEIYLDLLKLSPSFYIEEIFKTTIQSKNFMPRKMIAL